EVLARVDAAAQEDPGTRALALWWASGLEPDGRHEAPARVDGEGWVALDGRGSAARLRPWTWGERLAAEQEHLLPGEGFDFDAIGYLEAMIRGCLLELRGPGAQSLPCDGWSELDAQGGRRLLAALSDLNHPDAQGDPLLAISPALAASTLRLCAALGWTPERVLATPAAQVQRLLALLDRVGEGGRPVAARQPVRAAGPRRRKPRMAEHPDAVVILFDEQTQGDQ
ncbi:MAG: hypothetical protein KC457_33770, partial [Myxococcales bacterium]|nr:hypothetical protein [Myxococcales bacterium]